MPERPDMAAAVAAPPLTNLIRAGGEMFNWTDPADRDNPLLTHLVVELAGPGRTVLVAGPHPGTLVAALTAGGAEVTWLLRSLVDAETAARAHPGVTVLSGAFGKADLTAGYDVVVATDGIQRLNSAEGDQLPAGELLDRLAGAVRPDGALILMHDNQLGAHHTVRLDPGARHRDDSAWYPAEAVDGPAARGQLTARLAGAGLVVDAAYAAFPEPGGPGVLVGGATLGDVASPLRPWLRTVLAQAYTSAFRGRPVLSDPRRLVDRALRAGAEDTVAGGWLVIAHAPGGDQRSRAWDDVLIEDGGGVYALGPDGPRTLVPPRLVEVAGLRRAELIRPAGGPGLEERLLDLCAAADVRGLRREIARYEVWLSGQPEDGPAVLADLSSIAVTGDDLTVRYARWTPTEPVPVQVALVRALWQFAVRLITWSRSHPWPITASAADLAAILVGMSGRSLADEELRAAIDLQMTIDSAEYGLGPAEQRAHRLALRAVQPGTAPLDVAGYRDLTEALWRQRYQASHLLAMMEWNEQIIRSRDNALSKMDWELSLLRRTWGGRSLMLAKRAYKKVKK
ncbi:class I SAM-dependent methyltransferase [Actinoplanes sp. G11-F43]|uniref:class I SAM-dependent methyltransferase n=1 Tax=Actinoplanes sp. G11-F43 TaxID=3424130 RepID=UPI003D337D2E